MKRIGLLLLFLVPTVNSYAENLPSSVSREPHCVTNTYCLKKHEVYVGPASLPEGFASEPYCGSNVNIICLAKFLSLEESDLTEIKDAVEAEVNQHPSAGIRISPVMRNIVLVSIYKHGYFGIYLLFEKQGEKGWVAIRRETAIY